MSGPGIYLMGLGLGMGLGAALQDWPGPMARVIATFVVVAAAIFWLLRDARRAA